MSSSSLFREPPELSAFVQRARERFQTRFPDHDFDSAVWETTALRKAATDKTPRLYFTLHGSQTKPLPSTYSMCVKAWIVLADITPSRMADRLLTTRWLWRSVSMRLGPDADTLFSWRDLRHSDLQQAERLMIEAGRAPGSVHKAATTMGELASTLGRLGIAPSITYSPVTKRVRDSHVHHLDDADARSERALSDAALNALADIFARAEQPRDVIFSSLIALLYATGLRFAEGVTLPLDPLEVIDIEARDSTGHLVRIPIPHIHKHKAKSRRAGGEGRKSREAQPLTDSQGELARLAIERLHAATSEARALAKRLEETMPRWVWPSDIRPLWLYQEDIVRTLNCGSDNANLVLRQIGEPVPEHRMKRGAVRRCSVTDLEEYMSARQDWNALSVIAPTAGMAAQRASESLFCLRRNETHPSKATLPLITSLSHSMMDQWLAGDPKLGSLGVFERFEKEYGVKYLERDGSPVRVTSKMCRHLFVTNALTAGATHLDIARWQGREHLGDIRTYDNRSMAEKVAAVKDLIMTGRLQGQVAQAYVRLADDVRDEWLEGQVQAMHVTSLGICVHDFTATPCPKALNCVDNCEHYLHDPNNPEERHALVQLQRRTKETLALHRPLAEAGKIAPSWIEYAERIGRNVDQILATPAGGGLIRPFAATGEDRFKPLEEH